MDKSSSVIEKTLESGNSDTNPAIVKSGRFSPAQPLGTDKLTVLLNVCQHGKLEVLKEIASTHPECMIQAVLCQYSLLHCACNHDQVYIIQYLIDNGLYDETILIADEASSPLHLAVKAGHLATVNYLLEHSPCNPMLVDKDGDCLMHTACVDGHLHIVKYLAKTGKYDENIVNCHTRQTPLHVAAKQGHLNIVQYLVEETKSDPSCVDDVGRTALYLAVWSGRINIVQYLSSKIGEQFTVTTKEDVLDNGSSVAAGKTPLHAACLCGHYDIVCYLVEECHYNITCSDVKGNLPLHSASAGGNLYIVKYLIEECRCDPMSVQNDELFPLHIAASNGHLSIVKYLIEERGCDPMCQSHKGHVPLHFASENGHFDTVKYLIEDCQCDPMCFDFNSCVPLHFASRNGHLSIATYLIVKHGCDPLCHSKKGSLPLHLASENGHFDTVKYLIEECRCDPMSRMCDEKTQQVPLHFVAMKGHLPIAKYLIEELGCNPKCRSNTGFAPLHFASENGHYDTVKYLIEECQCDPMLTQCDATFQLAPLHFVAMKGHLHIAKYLIEEHGCDPNCLSKIGFAPLHFASANGHYDTMKYLIEKCQCDPMSRVCDEKFQQVPLHFAAMKGHLSIAKYLIEEHGCDPMCHSETGFAPLHFATEKGHTGVVKYLIEEKECSTNGQTKEGLVPLHLASKNGHLDLVKYFIKDHKCDHEVRQGDNQSQWTPLHFAASEGHLPVMKYLIEENGSDPEVMTRNNHMPFFLALTGKAHQNGDKIQPHLSTETRDILYYLLSKGVVPEYLPEYQSPLFHCFPFLKYYRNSTSSDTLLSEVIVIGSVGAGKSSLIKHLSKTKKVSPDVKGISPHLSFSRSKLHCNVVYYEVPGLSIYNAINSALVQRASSARAVFVLVLDLQLAFNDFEMQLNHWLSYMNSHCKENFQLIIVGSHIDCIDINDANYGDKRVLVNNLQSSQMHYFELNCCKSEPAGLHNLRKHLIDCHKQPLHQDHPFHRMLYACFIMYFSENLAFKLLEIYDILQEKQEQFPFPCSDCEYLSHLCQQLDISGHILYLKDKEELQNSWIVINVEKAILAMNKLKFKKLFRSNMHNSLGIVSQTQLHNCIKYPESIMKLGNFVDKYMTTMGWCQEIEDDKIITNVLRKIPPCETQFFFPNFVNQLAPKVWIADEIWTTYFGWCLKLKATSVCFNPYFIEILLLRIVAYFNLSQLCQIHAADDPLPYLKSGVSIWLNGIYWKDDGCETIVEVVEEATAVIVMIRCKKDCKHIINHCQIRSAVVSTVLEVKQKVHPDVDQYEYILHPEQLCKYPPLSISSAYVASIGEIVDKYLAQNSTVDTHKMEGRDSACDTLELKVEQFVDPILCLRKINIATLYEHDTTVCEDITLRSIADDLSEHVEFLCELLCRNLELLPNSTPRQLRRELLHDYYDPTIVCFEMIKKVARMSACGSVTCVWLRQQLEQYSIFRGRNPLVSNFMWNGS